MTYLHKSMQITPLEHCFWLEKPCKMDTKSASKIITYYPSTTFKTRSYLAYLRRGVRSLTNKPSMKRLGVKKKSFAGISVIFILTTDILFRFFITTSLCFGIFFYLCKTHIYKRPKFSIRNETDDSCHWRNWLYRFTHNG